jgi:hypothetical protein
LSVLVELEDELGDKNEAKEDDDVDDAKGRIGLIAFVVVEDTGDDGHLGKYDHYFPERL